MQTELSRTISEMCQGKGSKSETDRIAALARARIADLEAELKRYHDLFGPLPLPGETWVR